MIKKSVLNSFSQYNVPKMALALLVAPAYRDGFRMLFDYDYVRDRICREGAIRYAYVRNDGERFLITIFPDTHSVDEVMWVFAKEDTSSEE